MKRNEITDYLNETPQNTNPAILGQLFDEFEQEVKKEGGASVQSDWFENDPKNPAYVKNRFGGYEEVNTIISKQTAEFTDGQYMIPTAKLTIGVNVNFLLDGTIYTGTVGIFSELDGVIGFGNGSLLGGFNDTGEPFVCVFIEGAGVGIATSNPGLSHEIELIETKHQKINSCYMPSPIIVDTDSKPFSSYTWEDWQKLCEDYTDGKTIYVQESPWGAGSARYARVISAEYFTMSQGDKIVNVLRMSPNGEVTLCGTFNGEFGENKVNLFAQAQKMDAMEASYIKGVNEA